LKRNRTKRGYNILGRHIRQARLRVRPEMSQADLAAKLTVRGLAVDRATVTRIENGNRYLRDFEVRAIAKILKVSVAWLFRETSDPAAARR
jgi:HTH-type transcriptional regulator, cell division transcriptional repressor